jgi:hypothetical protein
VVDEREDDLQEDLGGGSAFHACGSGERLGPYYRVDDEEFAVFGAVST